MSKSVVFYGVKAPESVCKIGKDFINECMNNATPEERTWVILTLEREVALHGTRKGFLSFRAKFADKFFPEIVAKNKPKKAKLTFLDELKKNYA